MSFRTFLKLVEIQTKIASLFPFVFATLYSLYRYETLNFTRLALMFISLLFFDMTTTAINNYMDYKKALDRDFRDLHNVIGIEAIPIGHVRMSIFLMITVAILAGILLTAQTGPVVLLLGILSFFVGIFYTYGPIPISRMPLGEILSGFMMGFVIIFISVYIHAPSMAVLSLKEGVLVLQMDLLELVSILLVSSPFIFFISNLMLANNLCDLEQDVLNDRFLLPYYLGIKVSLLVFRYSYFAAYLFIVLSVILKILPLFSLLSLISFPLVLNNIRLFEDRQIKGETFALSVQNLTFFSLGYIFTLVPGLFV
ncbi:1,4-dihydroxy-2-naphthoate polyprenyltransferase [Oceanispirochaeta crateris]|uniref:1,4-dihydroxy-2-naphthoate polyprenyltransferase n=1 Tax=Oceanispirochaeta crateris TaxID=2518645 RepID=A0A5C1QLV2_9SPIO|nr:1,4-dihydroxy-2-naphthoate polyprenyltransferase [Oceanispirochaeta crateris]QEN08199.1 1,4-dihydroxy-2-naphthoate polyprenyltransferase [Oceanispirochaeta crateris]